MNVRQRTESRSLRAHPSLVLHDFINANRTELIARCREQVERRPAPEATAAELEVGVPLFLDQLSQTLKAEQDADTTRSVEISGSAGSDSGEPSEICVTELLNGREL